MTQEQASPLLGAWNTAYRMVAGANPWEHPDLGQVARLTRRILAADSRRAQGVSINMPPTNVTFKQTAREQQGAEP